MENTKCNRPNDAKNGGTKQSDTNQESKQANASERSVINTLKCIRISITSLGNIF